MGTALEISVAAPSREKALDASEAAVCEIERVDALLSTWRSDTPLARLDAAPAGTPVALPGDVLGLLGTVFEWGERTEGAFEPAILPLVKVWGLRTGGHAATDDERAQALRATGARWFLVDLHSSTASRLHAAAGIDEGAWGKGYALDRAAEALKRAGACSAALDLGGQVLFLPSSPSDGIRVGLADPRDRARVVGRILLRSGSLSTSGNSERFVSAGGHRIGHLLDPRTGQPADDFGSVTVLASSGLVADILSTAFFVLGPEEGARLSHRLRADGVAHEVLFLIKSEGGLEARASGGFLPLIRHLDVPIVPFEEDAAPATTARTSIQRLHPGGELP